MRCFHILLMWLAVHGSGAALLASACAQSLSGVSGAEVTAGDDSFEYRFAFAAAGDGREEGFAHRLHFQHAFDDSWRVRVIAVQGKRGAAPLATQSASIEIQKQFRESDEGGWASAIRVDGLVPIENGPGRARAAWLNLFEPDDRWQFRANIYLGKEFGDLAKDGLTIETREQASYQVRSGLRIGLEAFNKLNTTARIGGFNAQQHQIGPIVKGRLSTRVKFEAGALFGVSRAASDLDLRLFVSCAL